MSRFLMFQILIGFVLTAPAWSHDNQSSSLSTPMVLENILQDIRELSHPTYRGRQAGTDGGLQSANYLVDRFRSLGLQPVNRFLAQERNFHWLQQQPMTAVQLLEPAMATLSLVNANQSSMTMSLVPGQDVLPVLDSPAARITACMQPRS